MTAVAPGATLGILGGGQLGRMMALAARQLGYRLAVIDPDPACAARPVVETVVSAPFDDVAAVESLARQVAVLTAEIETLGAAALSAASRHVALRPSAELMVMVQDRGTQKAWLSRHGFPLPDFAPVHSAAELQEAVQRLGAGCFIKTTRGGYDGRGQARYHPGDDVAAIFAQLGARPLVVERAIDIEREISVLVARRPSGEVAVYPVAHNHHERQVLAWSVLPAGIPAAQAKQAQELARAIAEAARLEGLLAVELFVRRDGALLVNELAPRPHNSYHTSELACVTSQFEQAIRAACDLPLGSVELVRPAAIRNLLGDLWHEGEPDFVAALRDPDVKLRLYGKGTPRPGRKMGHLVAVAATAEAALAKVNAAYDAL